jgi:hypothetical protein
MNKIIKAILLAAATVVILIPTFVLSFQLVRTAPEVYMGEENLDPAFVTWSVTNRNGEEVITSISEARAERKFNRAEKITLVDVTPVQNLVFPREYVGCAVSVYNKTGTGIYRNVPFEDFRTMNVTIDEPAQVMVVVLWQISDSVQVKAAYSFEVIPT